MNGKECSYEKNKIQTLEIVGMILIRLRRGFKYGTLSILYGFSKSYIQKIVTKFSPLLLSCFEQPQLSRDLISLHTPLKVQEVLPNAVSNKKKKKKKGRDI